ncbi:High-affnity carbon uptake protein Hat/HatR [Minicystis rosea]|nr:High-affnity carbon uptake protein Hat/HatR [Minicystis rosea]
MTRGLGLACAAREALPPYLYTELLGGSGREGEDFLRVTRPLLLEEPAHWADHRRAYRPYHEHFRQFIAEQIGPKEIRGHHQRIAEALAAWPLSEHDPARRTYALRHAVAHRIEAGALEDALRLCTDIAYLEAKCRALGVPAIERDLEAAIRVAAPDVSLDLTGVLAAVSAESGKLREHPEALPSLLYNRLRCAGWSADRIQSTLRFAGGAPPLRLLHGVRLGPTLLRTFAGHAKPIVACAATPDGKYVLSASTDRTLRLWAAASGECIAVLEGHDDEITACAISPDGSMAVSTSADSTAKLWDLRAPSCAGTLVNDGRWATTCALSPDGRHLVIGSDNGIITVWGLAAKQRVRVLNGHTDYITACLVTRDGRVVSASRDGSVRVWSSTSETCLQTMAPTGGAAVLGRGLAEEGWVTALALMPDGDHVLSAAGDGSLSRWNLASGRCIQRFGARKGEEAGRVDSCAILHGGRLVLCGMADGALAIWDLETEQRVLERPAHQGAVSACAPASGGLRIFSGSADRLVKLWEIGGSDSMVMQEGHVAPITACAMTPDGRVAVSASEDYTLEVWDVASGARRTTLRGHADLVTACAISADGRRVLSGARDGSVHLWALDTGEMKACERHWAHVSGAAIRPDGSLITSTLDGGVWGRDASELALAREVGVHPGSIEALALTPDGAHAISISRDRTAKVWNIDGRRCERNLSGFAGQVLCVALSPDGRRVVVGLDDGRLEVRELNGAKSVRWLVGHAQRVFGCAVSADGERAISASEDGTVRVWSLSTDRCLGVLHGTSWFRCVAAADGTICAGDQEGNLWMIVDDTSSLGALGPESLEKRAPSLDVRDWARLRRVLATIYDRPEAARLVARDAGLDLMRIVFTGSVDEAWESILTEAIRRRRLVEIVRHALRAYPDDPELGELALLLGIR